MRDGVKLATDLYVPPGSGPFPVVVLRSPYDKNAFAGVGADAMRHGYACIIQDTRGRGGSEGENLPFEADGWANHQDGCDTLAWIARQAWCSGKVGTMGGSALGITQLLLAGAGAIPLDAQIIDVGAPGLYNNVVYRGGVFRKAMIEDWLRATKFSPTALGMWTSRPIYDAWWANRDLSTRWGRVDAPAIHAGGWYDIFCQGTIDAFLGYQTRGGPHARGRQKLIMGPWTHGIFQGSAGELTFPNGKAPPGAAHDPWRWFDHYLKGINNGIDRAPAVTYYVMGDVTDPAAPGNRWRTADRWPPFETRTTAWYLHGDRSLSTKGSDGDRPLTYAYDPKNPVPTVGGPQLTLPAGPMDQRKIEGRPDVLAFTSDALAAPVEVTGHVRMKLWAASDGPDTDWAVKLCDVYPDGRSINVCEGILRARFRHGVRREAFLTPGQATPFDIDLWSTSMIFNKGHRLRVLVTSSSAPGYDPNPNTGQPFRRGSATRIAHNAVYTDSRHPSAILLPVPAASGSQAHYRSKGTRPILGIYSM